MATYKKAALCHTDSSLDDDEEFFTCEEGEDEEVDDLDVSSGTVVTRVYHTRGGPVNEGKSTRTNPSGEEYSESSLVLKSKKSDDVPYATHITKDSILDIFKIINPHVHYSNQSSGLLASVGDWPSALHSALSEILEEEEENEDEILTEEDEYDDGKDSESEEDEFFDSRSTSSRLQSIDEGCSTNLFLDTEVDSKEMLQIVEHEHGPMSQDAGYVVERGPEANTPRDPISVTELTRATPEFRFDNINHPSAVDSTIFGVPVTQAYVEDDARYLLATDRQRKFQGDPCIYQAHESESFPGSSVHNSGNITTSQITLESQTQQKPTVHTASSDDFSSSCAGESVLSPGRFDLSAVTKGSCQVVVGVKGTGAQAVQESGEKSDFGGKPPVTTLADFAEVKTTGITRGIGADFAIQKNEIESSATITCPEGIKTLSATADKVPATTAATFANISITSTATVRDSAATGVAQKPKTTINDTFTIAVDYKGSLTTLYTEHRTATAAPNNARATMVETSPMFHGNYESSASTIATITKTVARAMTTHTESRLHVHTTDTYSTSDDVSEESCRKVLTTNRAPTPNVATVGTTTPVGTITSTRTKSPSTTISPTTASGIATAAAISVVDPPTTLKINKVKDTTTTPTTSARHTTPITAAKGTTTTPTTAAKHTTKTSTTTARHITPSTAAKDTITTHTTTARHTTPTTVAKDTTTTPITTAKHTTPSTAAKDTTITPTTAAKDTTTTPSTAAKDTTTTPNTAAKDTTTTPTTAAKDTTTTPNTAAKHTTATPTTAAKHTTTTPNTTARHITPITAAKDTTTTPTTAAKDTTTTPTTAAKDTSTTPTTAAKDTTTTPTTAAKDTTTTPTTAAKDTTTTPTTAAKDTTTTPTTATKHITPTTTAKDTTTTPTTAAKDTITTQSTAAKDTTTTPTTAAKDTTTTPTTATKDTTTTPTTATKHITPTTTAKDTTTTPTTAAKDTTTTPTTAAKDTTTTPTTAAKDTTTTPTTAAKDTTTTPTTAAKDTITTLTTAAKHTTTIPTTAGKHITTTPTTAAKDTTTTPTTAAKHITSATAAKDTTTTPTTSARHSTTTPTTAAKHITSATSAKDTTTTPTISAKHTTTTPGTAAKHTTPTTTAIHITPTTAAKDTTTTPTTTARHITPITGAKDTTTTPITVAKDTTKTPTTTAKDTITTPTTAAKDITTAPSTAAKDTTTTPSTAAKDTTTTPSTATKDTTITPTTAATHTIPATAAKDTITTPIIAAKDTSTTPTTSARHITPITAAKDTTTTPTTTARHITPITAAIDTTTTPTTAAKDTTKTPTTTAEHTTTAPTTTARHITPTTAAKDTTTTPTTAAKDTTPITVAKDTTTTPTIAAKHTTPTTATKDTTATPTTAAKYTTPTTAAKDTTTTPTTAAKGVTTTTVITQSRITARDTTAIPHTAAKGTSPTVTTSAKDSTIATTPVTKELITAISSPARDMTSKIKATTKDSSTKTKAAKSVATTSIPVKGTSATSGKKSKANSSTVTTGAKVAKVIKPKVCTRDSTTTTQYSPATPATTTTTTGEKDTIAIKAKVAKDTASTTVRSVRETSGIPVKARKDTTLSAAAAAETITITTTSAEDAAAISVVDTKGVAVSTTNTATKRKVTTKGIPTSLSRAIGDTITTTSTPTKDASITAASSTKDITATTPKHTKAATTTFKTKKDTTAVTSQTKDTILTTTTTTTPKKGTTFTTYPSSKHITPTTTTPAKDNTTTTATLTKDAPATTTTPIKDTTTITTTPTKDTTTTTAIPSKDTTTTTATSTKDTTTTTATSTKDTTTTTATPSKDTATTIATPTEDTTTTPTTPTKDTTITTATASKDTTTTTAAPPKDITITTTTPSKDTTTTTATPSKDTTTTAATSSKDTTTTTATPSKKIITTTATASKDITTATATPSKDMSTTTAILTKDTTTTTDMSSEDTSTTTAMLSEDTSTTTAMLSEDTTTTTAILSEDTTTTTAVLREDTITTTAMFSEDTTTTSDMPNEDTTTTTAILSEDTSTTTAMLSEDTSTTTAMFSEDTTTTSDMPNEDTTTTTAVLREDTITTTAMFSEDTTTTSDMPNEDSTTTTIMLSEDTTTITDMPSEDTSTTTAILNEDSTTTTVTPSKDTTTKTAAPAKDTTITTAIPSKDITTTAATPSKDTTTTTATPSKDTTTTTTKPSKNTTVTTTIRSEGSHSTTVTPMKNSTLTTTTHTKDTAATKCTKTESTRKDIAATNSTAVAPNSKASDKDIKAVKITSSTSNTTTRQNTGTVAAISTTSLTTAVENTAAIEATRSKAVTENATTRLARDVVTITSTAAKDTITSTTTVAKDTTVTAAKDAQRTTGAVVTDSTTTIHTKDLSITTSTTARTAAKIIITTTVVKDIGITTNTADEDAVTTATSTAVKDVTATIAATTRDRTNATITGAKNRATTRDTINITTASTGATATTASIGITPVAVTVEKDSSVSKSTNLTSLSGGITTCTAVEDTIATATNTDLLCMTEDNSPQSKVSLPAQDHISGRKPTKIPSKKPSASAREDLTGKSKLPKSVKRKDAKGAGQQSILREREQNRSFVEETSASGTKQSADITLITTEEVVSTAAGAQLGSVTENTSLTQYSLEETASTRPELAKKLSADLDKGIREHSASLGAPAESKDELRNGSSPGITSSKPGDDWKDEDSTTITSGGDREVVGVSASLTSSKLNADGKDEEKPSSLVISPTQATPAEAHDDVKEERELLGLMNIRQCVSEDSEASDTITPSESPDVLTEIDDIVAVTTSESDDVVDEKKTIRELGRPVVCDVMESEEASEVATSLDTDDVKEGKDEEAFRQRASETRDILKEHCGTEGPKTSAHAKDVEVEEENEIQEEEEEKMQIKEEHKKDKTEEILTESVEKMPQQTTSANLIDVQREDSAISEPVILPQEKDGLNENDDKVNQSVKSMAETISASQMTTVHKPTMSVERQCQSLEVCPESQLDETDSLVPSADSMELSKADSAGSIGVSHEIGNIVEMSDLSIRTVNAPSSSDVMPSQKSAEVLEESKSPADFEDLASRNKSKDSVCDKSAEESYSSLETPQTQSLVRTIKKRRSLTSHDKKSKGKVSVKKPPETGAAQSSCVVEPWRPGTFTCSAHDFVSECHTGEHLNVAIARSKKYIREVDKDHRNVDTTPTAVNSGHGIDNVSDKFGSGDTESINLEEFENFSANFRAFGNYKSTIGRQFVGWDRIATSEEFDQGDRTSNTLVFDYSNQIDSSQDIDNWNALGLDFNFDQNFNFIEKLTAREEDRLSDDSLGEAVSCSEESNTEIEADSVDDVHSVDSLEVEEEEEGVDEGSSERGEDIATFDSEEYKILAEKPTAIQQEQAKLRGSLSWLLSKVYGSNVPKELQDPFYENAEGQLVLRPVMVNLMSTSELYCQACSNMFPETHTQWQGHWSIIQVLSRKGIYISEVQDSAVTETVLVQTAPFKLKAHLALIDALMRAYIQEVASVEKVVKAVRRITTFPASSELPGTPEEALKFWINKVCAVLGTEGVETGSGEEVLEGAAGQKVRVVSKSREPVHVPLLEDLMRDIGDGCSVAAVIAYYRPQLLNIKDLCLKDSIGIADSLYNLRHIGQFCREHLPWKKFHLTYEDLLYTHETMKVNITTFLADLFYCFEGPGASGSVDGGGAATAMMAAKEKLDAMPAAGKRSTPHVIPSVPISNATKKSFQRTGYEDTASNLGMGRLSTSPNSHQPLLPRRGRRSIPQEEGGLSSSPPTRRSGRRTVSLCSPQDREHVYKSVIAWQDDQKLPSRSDQRKEGEGRDSVSKLLSNVSIDSAMNQSFNNTSMSINLAELDTPRTAANAALDPGHPDYLELESVTSGRPSQMASPQPMTDRLTSRGQGLEPLMPAVLRPTKEKGTNNVSKAEERGDLIHRKKKSPSELHPSSPSPTHSQRSITAQQLQQQQQASSDDVGVSLSTSSDATVVSPLPPGESLSPRYAGPPPGRQYEAFTVGVDSSTELSVAPLSQQVGESANLSPPNSGRAFSTAESYTVEDSRVSSAQAARAAGIPVVADGSEVTSGVSSAVMDRSREGSVASSGDYSDHESQKIHQDHKVRESGFPQTLSNKTTSTATVTNNLSHSKPVMILADHNANTTTITAGSGEEGKLFSKSPSSLTTNFAELKRLKDKLGYNIDRVDNSALIYMQSGSHGGPFDKMSGGDLKSTFVKRQGQGQPGQGESGKTSQQLGSAPLTSAPDNATVEANGTDAGSSELQQLRLKLEQKRKEIEKKKQRQELQQNRMRQRLGKAAFMRVVSKHMDGDEDGSSDMAQTSRSEPPPTSTQAQLQARLGHPGQKLPLGVSPRGQQPMTATHPLQMAAAQGTHGIIPPETSAQRFTDWRTQTQQMAKASTGGSGTFTTLATGTARPGQLEQSQQPFVLPRSGSDGGSDSSSASSHKSGNKAFSREGIQQTIDNVKNKWFRNDSDLITGGGGGSEEDDVDGDGSYRLHGSGRELLAGASARTMRESSQTPPRSLSQSPHLGSGTRQTPPPATFAGREALSSTQFGTPQAPLSASQRREASLSPHPIPQQPIPDEEYQEYDSSLDKLNNSLTELQGEIMRLSLQHEQLKAAQSPVAGQPGVGFDPRMSDALAAIGSGVGSSPSRPIHGIPQQTPYVQGGYPRQQQQQGQAQSAPATSVPYQNYNIEQQDHSLATQPSAFHIPQQQRSQSESSGIPRDQTPQTTGNQSGSQEQLSSNMTNDGFFVSFGDAATPKRSKPKLSDHRTRGTSPAPQRGQASAGAGDEVSVINQEVSAALAGQAIITPNKVDPNVDDGSPNTGFIIKDKSALAKEQAQEDEMQKKKKKLMEMQRKRKEEQERRKMEKEAEMARKQEEKMMKDEEQERKKAEEKARREAIFQQYLQKKQEEEEESSPVKPRPRRRDGSNSKPRPKSMFAKTKAATPEPGALGPDSGSSSQEDLTGRATGGGRSTPGVMSAMRSSYHFRLPQPSRMRKAVSCNTLQGPPNGAQGPSTYRRPPSPDLYRLKQQRQRGNSQDSGSETGSGSNPGSDYAGPKLFVKPSAKSNRHIIVNAISHCCLAGSVNTEMKNKVLEEMSKCDANHFLILFRDAGCQYRGLFIFYPETEEAFKVMGVGPRHIVNAMCEKFYKYNSGAKSFTEITSTKHLSVSVDAVVLQSSVWKSGRAAVKR